MGQWHRSGTDNVLDGSGTRPPHPGHLEPLDNGLGWAHCVDLRVSVHDDRYGLGVGPGELGAVEHEVELALRVVVEERVHRCAAPAAERDIVACPR